MNSCRLRSRFELRVKGVNIFCELVWTANGAVALPEACADSRTEKAADPGFGLGGWGEVLGSSCNRHSQPCCRRRDSDTSDRLSQAGTKSTDIHISRRPYSMSYTWEPRTGAHKTDNPQDRYRDT